MDNKQQRTIGGCAVLASMQVSDGFVVLLDRGTEFVIGTVTSMEDAEWTNGQYVTQHFRARSVFCDRVMRATSEFLSQQSVTWTRDPIEPDATLDALRHAAAQWRADRIDHSAAAGLMASLSDSLDAWLCAGGALPREWAEARD